MRCSPSVTCNDSQEAHTARDPNTWVEIVSYIDAPRGRGTSSRATVSQPIPGQDRDDACAKYLMRRATLCDWASHPLAGRRIGLLHHVSRFPDMAEPEPKHHGGD